MENKFDLLEKYLVNPIDSSLYDIGVAPSYFLYHFKNIFEDEEIYNKYGLLDKCFCCLSDDIRIKTIQINEIVSFLRNETSYSYQERILISNDIFTLSESYNLNQVEIRYCKKCKRIVALYEIPYVFYFNTLEKLNYEQYNIMEKEGTIGRDNWDDVRMCPRCKSRNIKHKNSYMDETGEVEFTCRCGNCDYFIGYFAYGAAEYPRIEQEKIFHQIFEKNFWLKEPELTDEKLPFN